MPSNELFLEAAEAEIDLQLFKANVPANTTTALLMSGGNTGIVVPPGYKFSPVAIWIQSTVAISAGTLQAVVTDNGNQVAYGPTAQLDTTHQSQIGVMRADEYPIQAGDTVGVSVIANAAFAPTTNGIDVFLMGYFMQNTTT
ncbi:MAG: hypothetical protein P4L50_24650 [Anaerolineaceae bacterium]|nr:hypothetical protein [Anaerolineaceae bacterium]